MVSYPQTDMKIPVRPAPAPPSSRPTTSFQRRTNFLGSLDDRNDTFMNGNISKSSSNINSSLTVKKKAPPRPPPPKINNHGHPNAKQNKSNVLLRLFSKSNQPSNEPHPSSNKFFVRKDRNVTVASLIDFDSPSSSPTFTPSSGSDGVSVHSFGSDSSTSNNGNTQSGAKSLFESVFEDDLDFFGGLTSNNIKVPNATNTNNPNYLCSVDSLDPFSQPLQKPPLGAFSNLENTWSTDLTENNCTANKPPITPALKPPPGSSTMPTIIRPKPSRPSTLSKPLQMIQSSTEKNVLMGGIAVQSPTSNQHYSVRNSTKHFLISANDSSREGSPPMPSTPPPPPPLEINCKIDVPIVLPELPPRSTLMNKSKTPHGIALYNYSTSHPDDLSFKANDLINILKKVNDEWFYGEIRGQRGMFPANFIEIIVPLDETNNNSTDHKTVTALFPFSAQQWEDLDFPEGAVIKVLCKINADWLYGEYQGKLGQFPSSFVDHVPSGLPPLH